MSKILAVFGATGQQGGSVINSVLADPVLSSQYNIRALTRDPSTPKLAHLKANSNVTIAAADVTVPSSLASALEGVHTVFAMTAPVFTPDGASVEAAQAIAIADAALAAGVKFFIFSTLPSPSAISSGKYTKVAPFESKAKAEAHIRTLPFSDGVAFYAPGWFMENFHSQPFFNPVHSPTEPGVYEYRRPVPADSTFAWLSATVDTGTFICTILSNPAHFRGKTMFAAADLYTQTQIAELLGKATGKKVVYKQSSWDEFRATVPAIGDFPDIFVEMLKCQEEYGGLWGPVTAEGVKEAVREVEASGRHLIGLEEYFLKDPPKF